MRKYKIAYGLLVSPLLLCSSSWQEAWRSAVELRNGDRYFISNKTVHLTIHFNQYIFQEYNLFYYRKRDQSTSFLPYVPTHRPKKIELIPSKKSDDGVEEGAELLVATEHCLCNMDIQGDPLGERMSIDSGDCYESGIRDGPRRFARFNSIGAIAASGKHVWAVSDNVILEEGRMMSRLCLIHNNFVITIGGPSSTSFYVFEPIRALSISVLLNKGGLAEIFISISWMTKSGLDILWIPRYSAGLHEMLQGSFEILQPPVIISDKVVLFSQLLVNTFRFANSGERQLYIFTLDEDGIVARSTVMLMPRGLSYSVLQRIANPRQIISLFVDFPLGIFVADSLNQSFARINSLGCICAPGYALLPSSPQPPHCQIAPAGGYVDILGNFIPCPAGTFEAHALATSNVACLACPPFKIAQRAQSVACSPCISTKNDTGEMILLPHNPERTHCLAQGESCPLGTYLATGACLACPAGFSSVSPSTPDCRRCPYDTYSDPSTGAFSCTQCPQGKTSREGSACSSLCPKNGCASRGEGPCVPSRTDGGQMVVTITILGIDPVAADAASNGTVYVAGFQLLIVIDKSGSAIHIPISEFTMIRDIKLSHDENVLYAAVNAQDLLCLTFVGTPRIAITQTTCMPGAAIVGIFPVDHEGQLLVHDTLSNSISLGKPSRHIPWTTVYSGQSHNTLILSMLAVPSPKSTLVYILVQRRAAQLQQQLIAIDLFFNTSSQMVGIVNTTMNHHFAYWRDQLTVSVQNAVGWLTGPGTVAGMQNVSGRVDQMDTSARFTLPGPMISHRLNPKVLLVVDKTGLRAIYDMANECLCEKDFYLLEEGSSRACIPCPEGMVAVPGTTGQCTACSRGQYFDPSGKCVPCPKFMWWKATGAEKTCPVMIDTMVTRDAAGLSLMEIFFEMTKENPQHTSALNAMLDLDYLSTHTLQIPLRDNSIFNDNAANARFWVRTKRIRTPPQHFVGELSLPGFWIVCSAIVLQTETCICELPAGGLQLGLWQRERSKAAALDFASLLIAESIDFINISVSQTSLFVSRTDAGGGRGDDGVVFLNAISSALQVPIPAPPASQASFASCITGWPATYSCPAGSLWVPPLFTCVPCKPGFFFFAALGRCIPCSIGSFSSSAGSTTCTQCASVRVSGSSSCHPTEPGACPAGFEMRHARCSPCITGFFKSRASDALCSPCAPGTYSAIPGQQACTPCPFPAVSTQWGSTECTPCATGHVPSLALDACMQCLSKTQFFTVDPLTKSPLCMNKTTLQCGRGYYLRDGGSIAENHCVQCTPCRSWEVMAPYHDAHPCDYVSTSRLGAPYQCISVDSFPGLFARLSLLSTDLQNFSIQYTACAGMPAYASWSHGPDPTLCFFKCNYGISEAGARQYSYFYAQSQGVWLQWSHTLGMVLSLPAKENLFVLDYPGLSPQLMLLAGEICLPCPKTTCSLGKYRPITDSIHGCGPPTCAMGEAPRCQVFPGGSLTLEYENDGCLMNCTAPSNAYISSRAPPGTGDNCGWTCLLGFFKDEAASGCVPCRATLCEEGQEFIASLCLPSSKSKSDFCVACETNRKDLGVLSPNTPRGVCAYDCPPGTYYADGSSTCVLCNNTSFCPTGFRRVCAPEACTECPRLSQALWISAVTMPSNSESCQVACKQGYHTVDIASGQVIQANALARSYDAESVRCTLCSLRPHLPCAGSHHRCPHGYFMPVVGSGICKLCPSINDCEAGFFPSGCICALCSRSSITVEGTIFVHRLAIEALFRSLGTDLVRREIVVDSETCPTACSHNSVMAMGKCTPCSAFVESQDGFFFNAYYAVWNASNGVRWWNPRQDPPHLPPRPSSLMEEERRAGLCWPCPVHSLTADSDWDLCMTMQREPPKFKQSIILPVMKDSESKLILSSADIFQSAMPPVSSILLSSFSFLRTSIASRILGDTTASSNRRLLTTSSSIHFLNAEISALENKGIVVHSRVSPWNQHHAFQTCPAFAEWYDPERRQCICKEGFQRHSRQDTCIPLQKNSILSLGAMAEEEEADHHTIRVVQMTRMRPQAVVDEVCPKGKYKDTSGNCRLCPLMHVYDGGCVCRWACSQFCLENATFLHSYHDAQAGCSHCPESMVPLHPFIFEAKTTWQACGCPKGHQLQAHSARCELCPRGTFSASIGLSPCTPCPEGSQTLLRGAERLAQCLRAGIEHDSVFVHPGDPQFYLKR